MAPCPKKIEPQFSNPQPPASLPQSAPIHSRRRKTNRPRSPDILLQNATSPAPAILLRHPTFSCYPLSPEAKQPGAKMKNQFWISLLLAALPALTLAAERPHAKARFLADAQTIKPGESFNVAVRFDIDPRWHIYWENPGDSGSPTRVVITAPTGVTIGPMQYPLPTTFDQPGDIKGYGYEDEVMLIARVTVPKDWPAGKSIDLTADTSWLSCKDVCLQGKAKLDLSIAVADKREADNTELFTKWRALLPISAADASSIVATDGSATDLTLIWKQPVKEVEVLPIPPDGIEVATLTIDHADKTTHIKPVLRLLGGEKKPGAALPLLVTYNDADGQRHGIRLSIPLKKP
jgi:DsbC/DsbD-like thiol-disulfide interchange protein